MRLLILLSCPLLIAAAPPSPDSKLREMIQPVSGAEMKRTVEKLVSFGTRHTLSSQTDPKRGIGAALEWTQGQFRSLGLPTERPCDTFTGSRIPSPTRVCDMIAIQRGTERPNDVVVARHEDGDAGCEPEHRGSGGGRADRLTRREHARQCIGRKTEFAEQVEVPVSGSSEQHRARRQRVVGGAGPGQRLGDEVGG